MILEMKLEDSIVLCCVIWDDPEGLQRILDQETTKQFDGVMVVDGKFKGWKGESEYHSHSIRQVCKYKSHYSRVEYKTEAEKRNWAYNKAWKLGYNWILICDSDEIPWFNRDIFEEEIINLRATKLGCFSVIVDEWGKERRSPRLLNLEEHPFLHDNHSEIFSGKDGRDMVDDLKKLKYDVQSITLKHDKEFHSKYRFNARNEFGATKH